MCSNFSVGYEQDMDYCWDCSGDDACVCFDEVYEVLVVDCCVYLLDYGAFEEVAKVELF